MKPPSLVVRNTNGEVEIVNVGSQIASTNTRFGPYKWGLLSYKSSYGFTIVRNGELYPLDSGLTAQAPGGKVVYGRHYTAPAIVASDRMACLYSLGRKFEQFQASVAVGGGFQSSLSLHEQRLHILDRLLAVEQVLIDGQTDRSHQYFDIGCPGVRIL